MKKSTFIIFIGLILSPMSLLSHELVIYSLWEDGFIPLTDRYRFYEYEGSSVIAEEYLGDIDVSRNNQYHELPEKNRRTFLARMDIFESDKLFLYNYVLDTLIIYKAKDLKLVARLNGCMNESPVYPFYYMIGFEIEKLGIELLGYTSYQTFVFIGNKNPFILGDLQPLKWEKLDKSLFPSNGNYIIQEYNWSQKPSKGDAFKYAANGLIYFLENLNLTESLIGRHLVVIESETDSLIYTSLYVDSESAALRSLLLTDEKSKYVPKIWTGKLFKNKPPVIFGLSGHQFGCPEIDFLSKGENSIVIRCDNRH